MRDRLSTSASLFFSFVFLATIGALMPAQAQNTISGTILGSVRDKIKNTLLPEVRVKIVNEANGRVRTIISNTQGEYRLPFLPEGSYTITATKETYLPETLRNFPVQFGQYNPVGAKYHKLTIDLKLSRPTLRGEVNDEAGRALPGASVVVSNQDAAVTRAALTDQDGSYLIPDLPPGYYFINASWNGEGVAGGTILLDREEVWAPAIRLPNAVGDDQSQNPQVQNPSSTVIIARQASEGEKTASLVRAIDAARSANFSERQVGSLPLGGATYMRTFDDLALLVAGVAPAPYTPGARGPGVGFGVGTAGQFSVNGMRARSNNFSVDGSDNNDADVGVRRQGFVALTPQSIESVDAFSVATLLWDAELGRNAGGQVNVVSKYGLNQFHGLAYGFFTDSSLNARNFFDYTGGPAGAEDPFTRSQLGASIGGPIIKDRTHFFAGFERLKINASTEQHFATPSADERCFPDVLCPAGAVCPCGKVSALALGGIQSFDKRTPLGDNIFSLYPNPNHPGGPFGANTLTQVLPADGDGAVASLRLTHQFPESHTFNARYNFTDDNRTLPSVNRAINSTLESQTKSHNLSLVFDSALGPTRFNQARFSFGRTRLNFQPLPNSPFIFERSSPATITLPQGQFQIESQTGPIGELVIEPFSPVGVGVHYFPQDRASNTFQSADTFSWIADKHLVKFGGAVRRYQLNSRLDRLYRPQVVYGGGVLAVGDVARDASGNLTFTANGPSVVLTGAQLASLGAASAVSQTITAGAPDSTVGLRFNEYHLFINDNWRARSNLTLDYGMRYEYNSVPHSVDKRIERALTLETLPSPGVSRFNTPERTGKFNAAVNAYQRILDGRNRIYDQDRNNFGPHFGLAWSPGGDGKTALRVGYGVYYDAILGAVVTQSRNVFPREIPINVDPAFMQFDVYSLNNPAFMKLVTDSQGNFTNPVSLLRPCNQFGVCNQVGGAPADFVALIGALFKQNEPGGGLAFTLPEKNLRTPYAQHWHLTAERELFDDFLFSAAYVGTKGTKLTRLVTPNLGSTVTPFVSLARDLDGVKGVILNPLVGSMLATRPGNNPSDRGRPDRNLGAYQVYENSAGSSYHALQLEARKRYNHGYQFTAAYTWSHAIDDVSDVFTIAGAPILPQNLKNLRLERGHANFDIRHRFTSSLIWDLPFYAGNRSGVGRLLARLLRGWQVAGIFQAQTGQPFTLTLPFDNNFDGNLSDRPANEAGLTRINEHGRQRITANRPLQNYLNFTVRGTSFDPGTGFVGRNTERGDGSVNLDLALNKIFSFTERQKLTFRAEFFNALNRANFGLPIRTVGAPGFGSAVETANPARVIQFALKFSF